MSERNAAVHLSISEKWAKFTKTTLYANLRQNVGDTNQGCLWAAYYEGAMTMRDEQRAELVRLVNLTSGDFAAVQRHCRLDAVASGCELLVRLRKVSEAKREPVQKSIGFIG